MKACASSAQSRRSLQHARNNRVEFRSSTVQRSHSAYCDLRVAGRFLTDFSSRRQRLLLRLHFRLGRSQSTRENRQQTLLASLRHINWTARALHQAGKTVAPAQRLWHFTPDFHQIAEYYRNIATGYSHQSSVVTTGATLLSRLPVPAL